MFPLINKCSLQVLISITLIPKIINKNYLAIIPTILIFIELKATTKMIVMIMGGALFRLTFRESMKYQKIIKYVSKKLCRTKEK